MSYTPEETALIVEEYNANPSRETVDSIAARIAKSPRSVIAKLAASGVYQTPERKTKTGDPIVKKEQMVADIELFLDIEVPTLVKAGKQDLAKVADALREILVDADAS
jgi:hypothetical protein